MLIACRGAAPQVQTRLDAAYGTAGFTNKNNLFAPITARSLWLQQYGSYELRWHRPSLWILKPAADRRLNKSSISCPNTIQFFLRNCARHNKHGKSSNKPIPDDCSVLCLSCQWRAVQQTELRGKSLVTHKKSRGTVPLFWCNTLHFSQTTNELTESGAELFSYFFLRQYMVWKNIKY